MTKYLSKEITRVLEVSNNEIFQKISSLSIDSDCD